MLTLGPRTSWDRLGKQADLRLKLQEWTPESSWNPLKTIKYIAQMDWKKESTNYNHSNKNKKNKKLLEVEHRLPYIHDF